MLFQKNMVIKGIYVHLCLLETFCFLADENDAIVLLEIIQQPPPSTQGDALSHLRHSSYDLLFMTASFGHCHMIFSFTAELQKEPKIANSKKSRYEVRKLPFPVQFILCFCEGKAGCCGRQSCLFIVRCNSLAHYRPDALKSHLKIFWASLLAFLLKKKTNSCIACLTKLLPWQLVVENTTQIISHWN